MKPIPNELIVKMPRAVEATRESCQEAADAVLHVLFLMGQQLEPPADNWALFVSNGVEVYPLPAPWTSEERRKIRLLVDLNGNSDEGGYLEVCHRNALEFNEALESRDLPLAQKIAAYGPDDSAHVWNSLNALALTVTDESVYRPLELSDETKQSYYLAVGLGS
jgi:hypothetical protein